MGHKNVNIGTSQRLAPVREFILLQYPILILILSKKQKLF